MVKFLQEIFPWLSTLPFAAKFLISAAVILIAGAILVLMWTPSPAKTEPPKPVTEASPISTPIQIQPSPVVTSSVTTSPTVKKDETPSQPPRPMWPQEKSLEALKRRLDRTSKQNRQILLALVNSGRDGLYVGAIERDFGLSRFDVLARGKDLQELQLIEIVDLTDKNYRLHDDVWNTVGPNSSNLLKTLLK